MLNSKYGFFKNVLDLGAGDGRFSMYGKYKQYLGVEIDKSTPLMKLPKNAEIINQCAFSLKKENFDLCIGNPPYVRHQELEVSWKQKYSKILSSQIGEPLNQRSNIFVYFLAQSLLKTSSEGKVVLIIPFEWVTRPSTQGIRNYIDKNNWSVSVYRFKEPIFPGVLTTASITIIDKADKNNTWDYYEIDNSFKIKKTKQPTGTNKSLLSYNERIEQLYAQRGLSPGLQKIFCLTEEERLKHKLVIGEDVLPCITGLKPLSKEDKTLTEKLFYKKYVYSNQRCWLVNSQSYNITKRLRTYFDSIDKKDRNTWTCNTRDIWWKFHTVKAPTFLYATSFTKFGPKAVINRMGVIAVNSAAGIYSEGQIRKYELLDYIKTFDFESRIVNHAGKLKRIEINQMNSVIQKYLSKINRGY